MRMLLPALLAAPILLGAVAARADAVPKLDVASTCHSSSSVNPDQKDADSGCLRSENEARTTLTRRWGEFGPDAKTQCSKQYEAGGFPSYVELLTCLELATGSVEVQNGREVNETGSTGKGRQVRDMPSTDANPGTRIDPIQVLGKPTGG